MMLGEDEEEKDGDKDAKRGVGSDRRRGRVRWWIRRWNSWCNWESRCLVDICTSLKCPWAGHWTLTSGWKLLWEIFTHSKIRNRDGRQREFKQTVATTRRLVLAHQRKTDIICFSLSQAHSWRQQLSFRSLGNNIGTTSRKCTRLTLVPHACVVESISGTEAK